MHQSTRKNKKKKQLRQIKQRHRVNNPKKKKEEGKTTLQRAKYQSRKLRRPDEPPQKVIEWDPEAQALWLLQKLPRYVLPVQQIEAEVLRAIHPPPAAHQAPYAKASLGPLLWYAFNWAPEQVDRMTKGDLWPDKAIFDEENHRAKQATEAKELWLWNVRENLLIPAKNRCTHTSHLHQPAEI